MTRRAETCAGHHRTPVSTRGDIARAARAPRRPQPHFEHAPGLYTHMSGPWLEHTPAEPTAHRRRALSDFARNGNLAGALQTARRMNFATCRMSGASTTAPTLPLGPAPSALPARATAHACLARRKPRAPSPARATAGHQHVMCRWGSDTPMTHAARPHKISPSKHIITRRARWPGAEDWRANVPKHHLGWARARQKAQPRRRAMPSRRPSACSPSTVFRSFRTACARPSCAGFRD